MINSPFFLSCKECRLENPRNFYGSFVIGPFIGSQSLTVANALRRTLLSELTGIAITSVQITDAKHEFSTLPGVRDSVLDILLNFKEIVLASSSPLITTQIGYLQVFGPGVVRACDLKLPPGIQCVDPDQYIATLSKDGKLNMKFTINEGKNYVIPKLTGLRKLSENQKKITGKFTLNLSDYETPLLIDAVFMPVSKVNYMVESYDNYQPLSLPNKSNTPSKIFSNSQVITLEIWTNGSLHPRQALLNGLNHLMTLFSQLEKVHVLNSTFHFSSFSKKNETQIVDNEQWNHNDENQNKIVKKNPPSSSFSLGFTKTKEENNHPPKGERGREEKLNHQNFKNFPFVEYNYYNYIEKTWKKSKTQLKLSTKAGFLYDLKNQKQSLGEADFNKIPISQLNLSSRSRKLLEKVNIYTVDQLLCYSSIQLKEIKGFGENCFKDVVKSLKEIGLQLKEK